jgi:hypothetical protein
MTTINENLSYCIPRKPKAVTKIKISRIAVLMAFTLFFLLMGCNTYQKQLNTFRAFAVAHTNELAPLCATEFPVKDSVGATKVDSTHKANNVNYQSKIDSLQQIADAFAQHLAGDTAKSNPCSSVAKVYQSQVAALNTRIRSLQEAYKPCKPDIVYKTQTVYRTDEAALAVANNKFTTANDSLKLVNSKLKDAKAQSATRMHWILILGGILLLLGIVTVLKFIGKL